MRHFGKYLFLGVLVAAIPFSVSRAVFIVPQGGLGVNRIPQGAWIFGNGQNPVGASSSPTVGFLTATSTTASSSFANGINLSSGCFAVNGTCISAGASLSFTAPLSLLGSTVSIPQASGSADGYLSLTDWTTFNTKFATTSTDYWFTTKSTTNLTEGSNLYYTDARVNTLLNASSTIPNRLCATNEILKWNGSTWVCGTDNNTDAFGYLFPSNATSTGLTFSGGLTVSAGNTSLQAATGTYIGTTGAFNQSGSATNTFAGNLQVSGMINGIGTSTFATGTFSRLNGVFTVDGIKYPKTGAGVKNAIWNAAQYASSTNSCGVVYVPEGTYSFGAGDSITFGGACIKLQGSGATSTRFVANGVGGGIVYDYQLGSSNAEARRDIEVSGITFDANYQPVIQAFAVGSSKNLFLHDNYFVGGKNTWTVIVGSIGGTLGSEDDSAIATSSSRNLRFINNLVASSSNGTNESFLCVNCRDSLIQGNTFSGINQGAATLSLFGYNKNVNVIGNIFANNEIKPIYIQESDHILLSGNNIYIPDGTFVGSIDIINTTDIQISNNIIRGYTDGATGGGGISVYDNSGTFDGHMQKHPNSGEISIKNNELDGYYYGVLIPSQVGVGKNIAQKNIDIINNTFKGGEFAAINIGHADTTGMARIRILGNTASTSDVFNRGSISITGSTTREDLLSNTEISGNYTSRSTAGGDSSGIYVDGAADVRIFGNFTENTGKGTFSDIQVTTDTSGVFVSKISTTTMSITSGGLLVGNSSSTITNLTTVNATTTNATTTKLWVRDTVGCNGTSALATDASGKIICDTDNDGGGGGGFGQTWEFPSGVSTAIRPTSTVGIMVNASSSITDLSMLRSTSTQATSTYLSTGLLTVTNAAATSTFSGGLTVDSKTLVVDYSTNRVGIGTTSPAYPLDVQGGIRVTDQSSNNPRGVISRQVGNFENSAHFQGVKSRGTNANPTAVQAGDFITMLIPSPYDGTNYMVSGQAGYQVAPGSTVSANNVCSDFIAATGTTTDDGIIRFRISCGGHVAFGGETTTDDINGLLYVSASSSALSNEITTPLNAARLRNNSPDYATLDIHNTNATGLGIYSVAYQNYLSGRLVQPGGNYIPFIHARRVSC